MSCSSVRSQALRLTKRSNGRYAPQGREAPLVECLLIDAHGDAHRFIEKVPVITADDLGPASAYPRIGEIACEVSTQWRDDSGRMLAQVCTERPWCIESITGETNFVVLLAQLKHDA